MERVDTRGRPGPDRALWITWYNLPEDGRDRYLEWCHARYLPLILERPGYLWAAHYASLPEGRKVPRRTSGEKITTRDPSVPRGDRYILIVGGSDAHVFGAPVPSALHAGMPEADRKMLQIRIEPRMNIMTEAARVEGPQAGRYGEGMVGAPCIQLGSFQCRPEDEEEALAWYTQWRLPAMARLAGCIRTRKLASVAGWAKHAIFYEFQTLDARNHFIAEHEDGNENREWTDRVIRSLTHAPGSANVALRIWPSV